MVVVYISLVDEEIREESRQRSIAIIGCFDGQVAVGEAEQRSQGRHDSLVACAHAPIPAVLHMRAS